MNRVLCHILADDTSFDRSNDLTKCRDFDPHYQVRINGDVIGEFDSSPGSTFTLLGIEEEDVSSVTLESIGLDEDEWISLLEVSETSVVMFSAHSSKEPRGVYFSDNCWIFFAEILLVCFLLQEGGNMSH